MTLSPKLPPARAPNWFPVLSPTRFGEMVATGKPASSPGKFPGSTLRVGWFLGTRLWVIDWNLSGQNGWNKWRETPFSRNPTWGILPFFFLEETDMKMWKIQYFIHPSHLNTTLWPKSWPLIMSWAWLQIATPNITCLQKLPEHLSLGWNMPAQDAGYPTFIRWRNQNTWKFQHVVSQLIDILIQYS